MLNVKYEYSDKKFEINPYNTNQEKDLLLLSTVENYCLDSALKICGIQSDIISSLTEDEKVAFLFKLREISVGEELHLSFKCKHCNTMNDNDLNISNIIKSSNIRDNRIKDQYKILTEENLSEFLNINLEELDLDEYEELFSEVKNSVTKFNFKKPIICQKCLKENFVKINSPEFVIDNMSEDSLTSIYQTYNEMIFHSHYTKQDIDSLYPFERIILFSLLNKTKEDLNGQ